MGGAQGSSGAGPGAQPGGGQDAGQGRRQVVNLLVLAGPGTPELKVLEGLPKEVKIVGIGRTLEDFQGLSLAGWDSVDVVLNAGILANAAKKETLQALWPRLRHLQWLHAASAGLEHFLFKDLEQSDVIVTNAKGCFSHSLAEFALTACNWFAKDLRRMRRAQEEQKWEPFNVEELRGRTMGIVGYGDIGAACAGLARAFKMNVIALRRRTELSDAEREQGLKIFPPSDLLTLMSSSDYVVASLPHTPATDKFVSAAAIAAMKPTGVFINVGRGKTVDEKALIKALQEGSIRGAGLDVFETEPLPPDSPLWELDNVLLSPHTADRTVEFQFEAIQKFVDNAHLFVQGQPLMNVIDKKLGY